MKCYKMTIIAYATGIIVENNPHTQMDYNLDNTSSPPTYDSIGENVIINLFNIYLFLFIDIITITILNFVIIRFGMNILIFILPTFTIYCLFHFSKVMHKIHFLNTTTGMSPQVLLII